MSYYDTAQVCNNGHLITDEAQRNPSCLEKKCSQCGAPTITTCPACDAPIRGRYHSEAKSIQYIEYKESVVGAYCYNCGIPYPWTTVAFETAEAIIHEDELLTEEEMNQFCECLPDLIVETPKTILALIHYKKLVDKAASATGPALLKVLIEYLPEMVKKALLGS